MSCPAWCTETDAHNVHEATRICGQGTGAEVALAQRDGAEPEMVLTVWEDGAHRPADLWLPLSQADVLAGVMHRLGHPTIAAKVTELAGAARSEIEAGA